MVVVIPSHSYHVIVLSLPPPSHHHLSSSVYSSGNDGGTQLRREVAETKLSRDIDVSDAASEFASKEISLLAKVASLSKRHLRGFDEHIVVRGVHIVVILIA